MKLPKLLHPEFEPRNSKVKVIKKLNVFRQSINAILAFIEVT